MVLIGVIGGFVAANVMGATGVGLFKGGVGGGMAAQQPTAQAPAQQPTAEATGEVDPVDLVEDHIRGNPDANIAVIEWSDLQCPFCARVHTTYKQLMTDYGDDIMWVYRHFPLNSIHPDAQKAAEGSECAAEQGGNNAFWEFVDLVFEKGSGPALLSGYAETIGLNADEFKECLDSGRYAAKVGAQLQSGTKAGVRGTPGNIILNIKTGESVAVSGNQPIENFKAAIDSLK